MKPSTQAMTAMKVKAKTGMKAKATTAMKAKKAMEAGRAMKAMKASLPQDNCNRGEYRGGDLVHRTFSSAVQLLYVL